MSELTTIAIYKSDQIELMRMLKKDETFREKIHELILKEKKESEGGNEDGIWKEETTKETRI
jgi:hypothetical protein